MVYNLKVSLFPNYKTAQDPALTTCGWTAANWRYLSPLFEFGASRELRNCYRRQPVRQLYSRGVELLRKCLTFKVFVHFALKRWKIKGFRYGSIIICNRRTLHCRQKLIIFRSITNSAMPASQLCRRIREDTIWKSRHHRLRKESKCLQKCVIKIWFNRFYFQTVLFYLIMLKK